MITNYFLLYFSALIISFSILGYGFLLSRIIDKNLSSYNLGYQGLLGILFLTFISYLTIFFTKHGYIHNIIVHIIGISSFVIYFKKKFSFKDIKKFLILFSILYSYISDTDTIAPKRKTPLSPKNNLFFMFKYKTNVTKKILHK